MMNNVKNYIEEFIKQISEDIAQEAYNDGELSFDKQIEEDKCNQLNYLVVSAISYLADNLSPNNHLFSVSSIYSDSIPIDWNNLIVRSLNNNVPNPYSKKKIYKYVSDRLCTEILVMYFYSFYHKKYVSEVYNQFKRIIIELLDFPIIHISNLYLCCLSIDIASHALFLCQSVNTAVNKRVSEMQILDISLPETDDKTMEQYTIHIEYDFKKFIDNHKSKYVTPLEPIKNENDDIINEYKIARSAMNFYKLGEKRIKKKHKEYLDKNYINVEALERIKQLYIEFPCIWKESHNCFINISQNLENYLIDTVSILKYIKSFPYDNQVASNRREAVWNRLKNIFNVPDDVYFKKYVLGFPNCINPYKAHNETENNKNRTPRINDTIIPTCIAQDFSNMLFSVYLQSCIATQDSNIGNENIDSSKRSRSEYRFVYEENLKEFQNTNQAIEITQRAIHQYQSNQNAFNKVFNAQSNVMQFFAPRGLIKKNRFNNFEVSDIINLYCYTLSQIATLAERESLNNNIKIYVAKHKEISYNEQIILSKIHGIPMSAFIYTLKYNLSDSETRIDNNINKAISEINYITLYCGIVYKLVEYMHLMLPKETAEIEIKKFLNHDNRIQAFKYFEDYLKLKSLPLLIKEFESKHNKS